MIKQKWRDKAWRIKRDVETVKKQALGVFEMYADGTIKFESNQEPRLGVLAIIGPALGFEDKYNEVLLAEIGVSQSRPYHAAFGLNRKKGQSEIPGRQKCFSLSKDQYQRIAPFVFLKLQELANKRVASWGKGYFSDDPFRVRTPRKYLSRHQKTLFETETYVIIVQGARFSIDVRDSFFISDVFWAELNLGQELKKILKGLAKFISLLLYDKYRNSHWQGESFLKLKYVQTIRDILVRKQMPVYLIKEMLDLNIIKDDRFKYILESIGIDLSKISEKTRERKLSDIVLSNPEQRLGKIQLRVTTGFEKKKDFIVFEVFPS